LPSQEGNFISHSSLLNREHPILTGFASSFPFETAIGMNGMVWVKAESPRHVITLVIALKMADGLPLSKVPGLVAYHKAQLKDDSMDD
jgi:exosome complex component RRP40